ncbi:histone deacetylase 11 [Marchantia polymorpha subsp. ruderalis]|uniref:histone deacetylase n=2 Tax=Marchantia polymorpha TaxID=3197 RepID=A0AAF6AWI5_MARPO|nr:hypothetical protein MARPO_0007s0200 [Marchantia polymorpha]BBN04119.1 hypothetical protein Mp_3g02110 [Marchantia polymorpha subsp. ruderalis]|eukprot:PTQ47806.1 hypothetical protein MARPO_0007s0200 [Marchantia polymorpha]
MGNFAVQCYPLPFAQLRARIMKMTTGGAAKLDGGSSDEADSQESLRERRIRTSTLYADVPPSKDPLIYSSKYNIGFMGMEKLHPFDAGKWGHIQSYLVDEHVINARNIVEPREATAEDLLVVHSKEYLESLKQSYVVAGIIEVPPVALLPNFIVQSRVLQPFRNQVGGTVLAGKVAKERGWAINLGGGFHHCCGGQGGGFCVYADITLCIQFAFTRLSFARVMIIDLDAHQGNGHERDFVGDDRVYILDIYNSQIYPFDEEAKIRINQRVELRNQTSSEDYLRILDEQLQIAKQAFKPDLIVYNAGTDILDGDPLGQLRVTPAGVTSRDEKVFEFAKDAYENPVPIVMVTSGGYMKSSARVIADSIKNLVSKRLITVGAVV